jgi:hypothetical protein
VQLRCASGPLLIWSHAAAQRCAAATGEWPQLPGCAGNIRVPRMRLTRSVMSVATGRNAQAAARDVAAAASSIRSEAAAGTASALAALRGDVERLAARPGDDLGPRLDSRLAVRLRPLESCRTLRGVSGHGARNLCRSFALLHAALLPAALCTPPFLHASANARGNTA